jgi:hypothetical protein
MLDVFAKNSSVSVLFTVKLLAIGAVGNTVAYHAWPDRAILVNEDWRFGGNAAFTQY